MTNRCALPNCDHMSDRPGCRQSLFAGGFVRLRDPDPVGLTPAEAGAASAAIRFVIDLAGDAADPESTITHLRSALSKIQRATPAERSTT